MALSCLNIFLFAQESVTLCRGQSYDWGLPCLSTSVVVYFHSQANAYSYNNERIYDTIVGDMLHLIPDTSTLYQIVSIDGEVPNCEKLLAVIVLDPPTISIDSIHHVTCPDGWDYPYADGSFYVSLDDPVQNYAWIDVINDSIPYGAQIYDASTLTGLRSGVYHVIAHGINGCVYHDSVLIQQPDPWYIDYNSATYQIDTVCAGQTGCIGISICGGTPPYNYTWCYFEYSDNGLDTIFLEDTTYMACGLSAGGRLYHIFMYDASGCKVFGEEIFSIFAYLFEYVEDSIHIITTNPIACYGSPFLAQAQSIGYGDYVWHVGDSVDSINWWTWVAADSVLIAEYYTPPMMESTLVSVDFYDQHGCVTHDSIWVDIYNPEISLTIETAEITTDSTFVVHVSPPGGSLYIDDIFISGNVPETYTLSTTGFLLGEHILRYYGIFGGELDLQCEDEISIPFQIQSHPFVTDWDQEVSIYPNPATTVLNLSSTEMMDFTIYITDVTGRVIMREKILDSFYPVDVSNLTSGIYLLRLETPEGASKSMKFVKR